MNVSKLLLSLALVASIVTPSLSAMRDCFALACDPHTPAEQKLKLVMAGVQANSRYQTRECKASERRTLQALAALCAKLDARAGAHEDILRNHQGHLDYLAEKDAAKFEAQQEAWYSWCRRTFAFVCCLSIASGLYIYRTYFH
jgi:hypothetical protein